MLMSGVEIRSMDIATYNQYTYSQIRHVLLLISFIITGEDSYYKF